MQRCALRHLYAVGQAGKQWIYALGSSREHRNIIAQRLSLAFNLFKHLLIIKVRQIASKQRSNIVNHILIVATALKHHVSKVRSELYGTYILVARHLQCCQLGVERSIVVFVRSIRHAQLSIKRIKRISLGCHRYRCLQHRDGVSTIDAHSVQVGPLQLQDCLAGRLILIIKQSLLRICRHIFTTLFLYLWQMHRSIKLRLQALIISIQIERSITFRSEVIGRKIYVAVCVVIYSEALDCSITTQCRITIGKRHIGIEATRKTTQKRLRKNLSHTHIPRCNFRNNVHIIRPPLHRTFRREASADTQRHIGICLEFRKHSFEVARYIESFGTVKVRYNVLRNIESCDIAH